MAPRKWASIVREPSDPNLLPHKRSHEDGSTTQPRKRSCSPEKPDAQVRNYTSSDSLQTNASSNTADASTDTANVSTDPLNSQASEACVRLLLQQLQSTVEQNQASASRDIGLLQKKVHCHDTILAGLAQDSILLNLGKARAEGINILRWRIGDFNPTITAGQWYRDRKRTTNNEKSTWVAMFEKAEMKIWREIVLDESLSFKINIQAQVGSTAFWNAMALLEDGAENPAFQSIS